MQMKHNELVDQAVSGNKEALEQLLREVEDMVFNLSLRMLGSHHDAEDASQEIYIRIITGLNSFRKEGKFTTWVYRIAVNHLLNYKKSMFAARPLSFEFYGADIENGFMEGSADLSGGIDRGLLAEELKLSCTNVMLQCFDPQTRIIYILGTMFQIDSKLCAEILDMKPDAYRQRLSRTRKKMAGFLKEYCGLADSAKCSCKRRLNYAITTHRLDPQNLVYTQQQILDPSISEKYKEAMEEVDDMSFIFAQLPDYRSPDTVRTF